MRDEDGGVFLAGDRMMYPTLKAAAETAALAAARTVPSTLDPLLPVDKLLL